MTICIAAIYSNDAIIAVWTKELPFLELSTEEEMGKCLPTDSWIGMIAEDNVSAAMPLLMEVSEKDTGQLTV